MTEQRMLRDEWLEARRRGIGASDAAAILGLSRFASPFSVYLDKVDPPPQRESAMMEWGGRLEPAIAQWFAEATGKMVDDPGDYHMQWDQTYDWLFCTPDRYVLGEQIRPLEIKCAWFESAREWDEKIPIAYQVQLQIAIRVFGVDYGYFAVLRNGYDASWYRLDRSDKFLNSAIPKLEQFWTECVLAKEPPPADWMSATTEAIKHAYREVDGDRVDLPSEAWEWHQQRCEALEQIAAAEKVRDEATNRLKQSIGNHEMGVLHDGQTAYAWKPTKRGNRVFRATRVSSD